MQLELKHNDNAWVAVGGLEFTGLVQSLASQAAGSLRISYQPELNGNYRFDDSDTIQLRGRDSETDVWVPLFSGKISGSPERTFGVGVAADAATAVDAWDELARTPFQIEPFNSASFNRSHVILFRDANGDRMTTADQITAALDHAISEGLDIQYVAADLVGMDIEPPADEQTDLTCADVIARSLRWQQDIFTEFDYSTTPPTLRFKDETDEQDLSVSLSQAMLLGGSMSIQRNDNKALRGVVINYEIENEIIDGTTQEIQSDSFGADSGPNVLVHTVSLDGSYVKNEESSIDVTCTSWPANWATDLAFVKALFPGNDSYFCQLLDAGTNGGATNNYYVTAGYQPGYNITANEVTVWWDVKERWKGLIEGDPDAIRVPCNETPFFFAYWYETARYSRSFLFTGSPSGTYTKTTPVVVPGESIPSGVAQAVYNARHHPLHSGMVPREIEAITDLASTRHNVSIQGSLLEYQDMHAPVQLVTRNWLTETELVTFGYPQQAGVRDFVDMLRANRAVNRPRRRTWKT